MANHETMVLETHANSKAINDECMIMKFMKKKNNKKVKYYPLVKMNK